VANSSTSDSAGCDLRGCKCIVSPLSPCEIHKLLPLWLGYFLGAFLVVCHVLPWHHASRKPRSSFWAGSVHPLRLQSIAFHLGTVPPENSHHTGIEGARVHPRMARFT
jgi:hypothetical protein